MTAIDFQHRCAVYLLGEDQVVGRQTSGDQTPILLHLFGGVADSQADVQALKRPAAYAPSSGKNPMPKPGQSGKMGKLKAGDTVYGC